MNETQASVAVEKEGYTEESMMFTYSEQEMEENKINRENAKRVFTPEYIPYHLGIVREYGLTDKEALAYGFIRFYMFNANPTGRFYFTNEQLAEIIGSTANYVKDTVIPSLKNKGLITCSYKMKPGGGSFRFVTSVKKTTSGGVKKIAPGGVKKTKQIRIDINKNNIEIPKGISNRTPPFKGNRFPDGSTEDERFTEFWELYPKKLKKKDAREAFKKVVKTPEVFTCLMEGLAKWKKEWDTWDEEESRFIPYPSSWLNGERWEDEIGQKKSQKVYI